MNVGECATGKGKMTLDVFADNWLFVMTSNIVPFDSISIKVVEYGKTGLFSTVLLDIFSLRSEAADRAVEGKLAARRL